MKTALITGSETFGRYLFNPTKWLALSAEEKVIADHTIYSLVFPSIIRLPEDAEDHGTTIVKKAMEVQADVILSFGMASEVKGFRIEQTATNWIENLTYAASYENFHPIDPTRPEKEAIHNDIHFWDVEKIQKLFTQAHIPFDSNISDNPGQYSCNGWIYRTVNALKKYNLSIPYLFVHTACTKEAIELIPDFDPNKVLLKKEDFLEALEIFLLSYDK